MVLTRLCLVLRSRPRWKTSTGWISMFKPRLLLYYAYQMKFFTMQWTRKKMQVYGVTWRFSTRRVYPTNSSWRRNCIVFGSRNTGSAASQCVQSDLSDMLALEVKLEEEDKTLILLFSLPQSYDHLAITIMYRNETLELEDIRQMLQKNKLMKKTYFTEVSGLIVKEQWGRSQSRESKKVPKLLV